MTIIMRTFAMFFLSCSYCPLIISRLFDMHNWTWFHDHSFWPGVPLGQKHTAGHLRGPSLWICLLLWMRFSNICIDSAWPCRPEGSILHVSGHLLRALLSWETKASADAFHLADTEALECSGLLKWGKVPSFFFFFLSNVTVIFYDYTVSGLKANVTAFIFYYQQVNKPMLFFFLLILKE